MPTYEDLQDRATASPLISVPVPIVTRYELAVHEGQSGHWVYIVDADRPEDLEVPPDFYLREARQPFREPSDALAFARSWGLPLDPWVRGLNSVAEGLGSWSEQHAGLDHDEVEAVRLSWRGRTDEEGNLISIAIPGLAHGYTLGTGRRQAATELGFIDPKWARNDEELAFQLGRVVHIAEVVERLEAMRRFCDLVAGNTSEPSELERGEAVVDLNQALSPFAPRIELDNLRATPHPSIYNVCALQIFNDIVEGVRARACQNETCSNMFTVQRGRADYGAHRTKGVLYCSKGCAKAQAQRELRRRRRKVESK